MTDDNATVDEEVITEQEKEQTSPVHSPRHEVLVTSAIRDSGHKRSQKYHGRLSINSSIAKEAKANEVG